VKWNSKFELPRSLQMKVRKLLLFTSSRSLARRSDTKTGAYRLSAREKLFLSSDLVMDGERQGLARPELR
jgi:hypothetical protein